MAFINPCFVRKKQGSAGSAGTLHKNASRSGHTKNLKNSIRSFRARRSALGEVRRVLCMCCLSCMSLNNVQSFVIDNCNGPPIENGLHNVCLHPLFRIFTFGRKKQQFGNSLTTASIARSTDGDKIEL